MEEIQEIDINKALEKISEAITDGEFNQLDIKFVFKQHQKNEWIGRVLIEKKSSEFITEQNTRKEE